MRLHCSFSMASANVLSLYRGPSGHAGKLPYLQEQMRFYQLNCMAIQEARSDNLCCDAMTELLQASSADRRSGCATQCDEGAT